MSWFGQNGLINVCAPTNYHNPKGGQSAACPRGHGASRRMRPIETSSEPRGHGLMAFAHALATKMLRILASG
jgi:hypothetical protein